MSVQLIIGLLLTKMNEYLGKRKFTGKIIFTIHCRQGSVAKCMTDIQENTTNIFIENNGCVLDKNILK